LAQRLAVHQPAVIVTGGEPKAAETAAQGRTTHANRTAGLAMEGSRIAFLRMRVFLKSPLVEKRTPRSVLGAAVSFMAGLLPGASGAS
jgi:hypothetical protein